MEITNLIKKIMESDSFSVNDLNDSIKMHINLENQYGKEGLSNEYIKSQLERIEKTVKDKLLQFDYSLKEDFLDTLIFMLFYNSLSADVKDIRIIDGTFPVIIREKDIELDDRFFSIDNLYEECPQHDLLIDTCDEELFSDYVGRYEEYAKNIEKELDKLLEKEGISRENSKIYLNANMDNFYFDKITSFKMIVTSLPDKIDIYYVKVENKLWNANLTYDNDSLVRSAKRTNSSLLRENEFITLATRDNDGKRCNLTRDTYAEDLLNILKKEDFTVEKFINIYNELINNGTFIMLIPRLKHIITEKLVQKGIEYNKAKEYTENIFVTIEEYKLQVSNAAKGECKFPNDSLVVTIKKLGRTL